MNARPQLKHVGLYVQDLARMEAFYAQVFDLVVTDRGQVARLGNRNIVFMSAAKDAHHQMVLIDGKDPASGPSVVFQLSFYVETLDALRRIDTKMRAQGVRDITPITHGNAWSIYASDPEGNGLEAYLDTPWHVAQPHGRPFDLNASDAEIWDFTQGLIKDNDTFQSREEWMRSQEQALR
jgi:catechol 2,3-dioxygenase